MSVNVLFVCIHNAGRSQMAEAFLRALSKEKQIPIHASSAGTLGAGAINPMAATAMLEIGISLDGQLPKQLTQEMVDAADIIITMGCGAEASACPARFLATEDWALDDPAGQSLESVRKIRDQIRQCVAELVDRLEAQ